MRGMEIVEEVIPDEGLESPPEYTLFTVPENWNPRSCIGMDNTSGMAGGKRNPDDSGNEVPYPPCYVEEEAPPEPNHPDPAPQSSPPHADYLSLLFEVRHLLADQVFRIERLEQ